MTGPQSPRRLPAAVAVIDVDHCTGCEACVEVCPVDCIVLHETGQRVKGTETWCEIDWERCIGCKLCIRLPHRHSRKYELTICPWGAIEMVPLQRLPEVAAHVRGPAEFQAAARVRWHAAAQRLLAHISPGT